MRELGWKDVEMKLIYIAGPYSTGDQAVNVNNAVKVADQLVEAGFLVHVPHLTHFWHIISPKPYTYWIKLDLEILKSCDAILRLPGESRGADIEMRKAAELSIPIFHSVHELVEYHQAERRSHDNRQGQQDNTDRA